MSYRSWLGDDRKQFADFNLCDFASMQELCAEAKWLLPAKAFSPSAERMAEFLRIMDEEYYMLPKDFSVLYIGDGPDSWTDYVA